MCRKDENLYHLKHGVIYTHQCISFYISQHQRLYTCHDDPLHQTVETEMIATSLVLAHSLLLNH